MVPMPACPPPGRATIEVDAAAWKRLCELAGQGPVAISPGPPFPADLLAGAIRRAAAEVVAGASPAASAAPAAGSPDDADPAATAAAGADRPLTYQVSWAVEITLLDGSGPVAAAQLAQLASLVEPSLTGPVRVACGPVFYLVDLSRPLGEQLVDVDVDLSPAAPAA
jgi:hypothetical protein